MTVYTHNGPMYYECTNIRMIVTDAPREMLNIDDDWYEVDAQEVADTEELCGARYPEIEGWMQVFVTRCDGHRVEHWGRL